MSRLEGSSDPSFVQVTNPTGASQIVLVCEHASNFVPSDLNALGLSDDALQSHAAWDPGAFSVAAQMSQLLDAVLVSSRVSRLVYDCNRPPDAPDAMPSQSETFDTPGNKNLTAVQRQDRAETYYEPFRATLADQLALKPAPILVTIHSFTPVYHGTRRDVEFGFLHDADSRLTDALLALPDMPTAPMIQRNKPYGPRDGVTHTLKIHALPQGRLNVMIEIRNDLLKSAEQQRAVAQTLTRWLLDALRALNNNV